MNSSIDIDKNNHFLGYYYGVAEVLSLNFSPQPGMFFVNGETNSVWVWDALTRMWIDSNRVDSGMKGMLTDKEGNSPSDFVPSPKEGIKESYFYVAECDDVDANTNAESKTITFTNFKNGTSSVSVTVEKTSIITLFWNGTYWETSVVPMNFDLNRLFKGTLYAKNIDGKLTLFSKWEKDGEQTEFRSNYVGDELGSVWRVRGDVGGILISSYWSLSLITSKSQYLFEYSDEDGNIIPTSGPDSTTTEGWWKKVTKCENLTPDERKKWNKAVTDLATEIGNRKDAIEGLEPKLLKGEIYIGDEQNDGWKLYYDAEKTIEIGYQSQGNILKVNGFLGGIAIASSSRLIVLSPNRALYYTFDSNTSRYNKTAEYKYVTNEEKSSWNKAVTDLAAEIENREEAIANINPKLFDGTIYIKQVDSVWTLFEDAGYTKKLLYQQLGYILRVKGGDTTGIAISNGSNLIYISVNRSIHYAYDNISKTYAISKEYRYVTAEDKNAWNKAVTDLTTVKNDISDLKQNQGSAASVKYATSVSVPRGGFVFADGASFLSGDKEEWLSSAMRELGLKHKSVAVGGQSILDTAYRLCKGTEYTVEELEKMDVFMIQHVHNRDVYTLTKERNIVDYEKIINAATDNVAPLSYAEAFDYVIKKHMANCYKLKDDAKSKWYGIKSGKPMQMLLCTHWHDARTTYNESVRKLCAKWGIALCEMDINIGFATSGEHPVATYNDMSAQVSLLYAQKQGGGLGSIDEADTQETNGKVYGWHQYIGSENFNYLTRKMASILMRCFVVSNVIEWSESFNMNNYKTQGVYFIKGERLLSENDNLPIMNASPGHTISGQLTVLDASLSDAEQCITQYLKLTNRTGSEGKEYVRTYNKYSNGTEGWSVWREIKQTANLNQISDEELKNYTENGLYEGVIFNGSYDIQDINTTIASFISALKSYEGARELPSGTLFTMEVLNNYAVVAKAEQMGLQIQQSIVQRATVLLIGDSYYEVYRKYFNVDDNGPRSYWSNWFIVGKL